MLTNREFRDTFAQPPATPACTTSSGQSRLFSVIRMSAACAWSPWGPKVRRISKQVPSDKHLSRHDFAPAPLVLFRPCH